MNDACSFSFFSIVIDFSAWFLKEVIYYLSIPPIHLSIPPIPPPLPPLSSPSSSSHTGDPANERLPIAARQGKVGQEPVYRGGQLWTDSGLEEEQEEEEEDFFTTHETSRTV